MCDEMAVPLHKEAKQSREWRQFAYTQEELRHDPVFSSTFELDVIHKNNHESQETLLMLINADERHFQH